MQKVKADIAADGTRSGESFLACSSANLAFATSTAVCDAWHVAVEPGSLADSSQNWARKVLSFLEAEMQRKN
jgi:hypothetical protein